MAQSVVPTAVRTGIVNPPNVTGPAGNRANNSYLPLTGVAGGIVAPDLGRGDRRDGSDPLGGTAGPVHLSSHRFDVRNAQMSQPPSAVEPGKGAIPVNPWNSSGDPNHAARQPDMPKLPSPPRQ